MDGGGASAASALASALGLRERGQLLLLARAVGEHGSNLSTVLNGNGGNLHAAAGRLDAWRAAPRCGGMG